MTNPLNQAAYSRLEIEPEEDHEDSQLHLSLQGSGLEHAAKKGSEFEHQLSLSQAIKAYPMAIFWAVMVSCCVIMEGYDTILIGNFYAYPTFAKKYGTYFPGVGYQLTAGWQAVLGNAAGAGSFLGVMLNGYLVGIFGHKRVLLWSLVVLSVFIFMTFFAPNIIVLCIGEILCGLPWGVFATIGPAYASEVLPLSLRIYLTSYTNMCFIIGQLIAAGVLNGLVDIPTEWSYRIPFALQWLWPAFLFPILLLAPESPWHLVRIGRYAAAEKSLKRLVRQSSKINTHNTLASIIHTNKLEQELSSGTSYWDCFKGSELRRTEIACMAFAGQVLSGISFAYNSTYFFQQVGLDTRTTYRLNIVGTVIALSGTLIAWFTLMPYIGRRTIYLKGIFSMFIILLLIGLLSLISTESRVVGMTQAILTLLWTFVFQLSVGQLGWSIPAEIGSTRLRQKTVCLARNAYYITSVISHCLEPYFMNPTQWNLKGLTGFIWAGTALVTGTWAFYRLPETRGRTFEDLDVLFARGVDAKLFGSFEVGGEGDGDGGESCEDVRGYVAVPEDT